MRQGQQNHYNNNNNNNNNKRMRGRNNRKGPNPLTRSYESNGGDVKIRGTALHIAEKYVQLARDAHSSGDRVASENYLQHAEHYYRMVAAAQAQMPQPQPVVRSDGDDEEDEDGADGGNGFEGNQGGNPGYQGGGNQGNQGGNQNYQGGQQPAFGASDPQPYVNGGGQGEDEGAQQSRSPNESRQDNRGQEFRGYDNNRGDQQNNGGQQNRERGDFRGRRRRPFRERYNEQGGPRNDAPVADAGPGPSDGPSGEE
ncbi:MAG: DUF4167 domain-containing protein [Bauldia sp.]